MEAKAAPNFKDSCLDRALFVFMLVCGIVAGTPTLDTTIEAFHAGSSFRIHFGGSFGTALVL